MWNLLFISSINFTIGLLLIILLLIQIIINIDFQSVYYQFNNQTNLSQIAKTIYITGITAKKLSILSITPPCPGNKLP